MATRAIGKKIIPALKSIYSADTNAGIWVRLLLLFVIGSIIGVALSLSFFLRVRGIGNQAIEPSMEVPGVREVDKEYIRNVLSAFSERAAIFEARLQNGISIPDPY